jgi:hypothetical protein
MNQVYRGMLASICLTCVIWTGGCGDTTNSVELPANPELAPGRPSAVDSKAPEIRTTNEHQ